MTFLNRLSSVPTWALTACALVVLGPAARLQAQAFATVEVFNDAPHGGTAVADVVIPLAKGQVRTVPKLWTKAGYFCQVRAMGARWPDQSYRYLKLDMPVSMAPYERQQIELRTFTGNAPGFQFDSRLLSALKSMEVLFHVGGRVVRVKDPQVLESGNVVQVLRAKTRDPGSSLWVQWDLVIGSGQRHARFFFSWGNSDPGTKKMVEYPIGVKLQVRGVKLGLDSAKNKVLQRQTGSGGLDTTVLLHHDGRPIADGQAQCFEGQIYIDGPAPSPRAIAHGWPKSMAFGPFGEVFPDVPVSNFEFERLLDSGRSNEVMDPWGSPVHGCYPSPTQTGGQPDFGVIVMREDVVRADPRRLSMIARSVYQEWCRPTHHMEADLRPVQVHNHPNLLMRAGRPYFRAGTWVDTLGKPARYLYSHEYGRDPLGRRFLGHDDQHYSINFLCAFAMVTGDRVAMTEIEHHVELWLSEFTVGSGTINDKVRAARAVGRSLMAGCWLWLLTGRQDLRARIEGRAKNVAKELQAPRTGEPARIPGVLHPRYQLPMGHFWAPWEEGLATIGLMAVSHLFGVAEARWSASVMSSTLVAHGIGPTPSGWRVGYFLPFVPDRAGYAYSALFDPQFSVSRAGGAGLTGWSLPAIAIASRHGVNPTVRSLALRMLIDKLTNPGFVARVDIVNWLGVVPRK